MLGNCDIIDLSRPVHTNMPVFPAIPKTYLGVYRGHKETLAGNRSWQANILMIGDHAGTHIDAPLHFNPEGTGIDQMPVEIMAGNAVVQDFSYKDPGDAVTCGEVQEKLERIGVNPKDLKFILFRTGAAEHYETDQYWAHYLEITVGAVEWMLDRNIMVFGVDASTVDHAKDRATHLLMKKRPCYHIENLANLEKLPQNRLFTFVCAPLLLRDSSASPIRALAFVSRP